MKKRAPCAAGAIDDLLVEQEEIVGIIVVLLANHIDEAGPAVANANHLITFAKRAKRDAADGWIKAWNITASGEDADDASFRVDVCHEMTSCPFVGCRTGNYPLRRSF